MAAESRRELTEEERARMNTAHDAWHNSDNPIFEGSAWLDGYLTGRDHYAERVVPVSSERELDELADEIKGGMGDLLANPPDISSPVRPVVEASGEVWSCLLLLAVGHEGSVVSEGHEEAIDRLFARGFLRSVAVNPGEAMAALTPSGLDFVREVLVSTRVEASGEREAVKRRVEDALEDVFDNGQGMDVERLAERAIAACVSASTQVPDGSQGDSLFDLENESLLALRELVEPLEDLPQSDRLMRMIGRALEVRRAAKCKGCDERLEERHTKACPFNRQGSKRVNKVQTRIAPVRAASTQVPDEAKTDDGRDRQVRGAGSVSRGQSGDINTAPGHAAADYATGPPSSASRVPSAPGDEDEAPDDAEHIRIGDSPTTLCGKAVEQLNMVALSMTVPGWGAGCWTCLERAREAWKAIGEPNAAPSSSAPEQVEPGAEALFEHWAAHAERPLDSTATAGTYADAPEPLKAKLRAQARAVLDAVSGPPESDERQGVSLIAAERERQVAEEGWTSEHDDMHDVGQLGMAAAAYAFPWPNLTSGRREAQGEPRSVLWPFDDGSFKPASRKLMAVGEPRIRELVKAGALIVAEIERLERAAGPPTTEER